MVVTGRYWRLWAHSTSPEPHLEWGRMLLARLQTDDTHQARAHLESARDLAHRYGCALVEQRAAVQLGRL